MRPVEEDGLADLVASVDERDLRAFLLDALRSDQHLSQRFESTFGEVDGKEAISCMRAALNEAKREHARGGFIDWREAEGYEGDVLAAMDGIVAPLVARGAFDEATAVTVVVLDKVRAVHIDDSGGIFATITYSCERYWDDIYAKANQSQRGRLLAALMKFAHKSPSKDVYGIYAFERERVEEYLVKTFGEDTAFAGKVQAYADEKIAAAHEGLQEAEGDESSWRKYRHRSELGRWACVRLHSMVVMGASMQELEAFVADKPEFLDCPDVFQFFADEYEGRGEYEAALAWLQGKLAVLEDAKRSGRRDRAHPSAEKEQLMGLHRALGDTEAADKDLYELVISGALVQGEISLRWFRELRERTDSEAWPSVRAQVLRDVDSGSVRCAYLSEEGLYAELRREIEEGNGDGRGYDLTPSLVRTYETELMQVDAEWVFGVYRAEVMGALSCSYDRKGYRRALRGMRHIRELPGGEAVASDMACEIRELYAKKPALLDELSKV